MLNEEFEARTTKIPWSGCWIWDGAIGKAHGYGVAWDGKYVRAHRLGYKLFVGDIPSGMHVLHRCDVRSCVNPSHLFLGTQLDNMRDMVSKGRINAAPLRNTRGALLSPAQVVKIRSDNRDAQLVAKEYGIARATVYGIRHRRTWKWVL